MGHRQKKGLSSASTTDSKRRGSDVSVFDFALPQSTAYPFDGKGGRLSNNSPNGLHKLALASYLFLHRHIADGERFIVCGDTGNTFDIVSKKGERMYRFLEGSENVCNTSISLLMSPLDGDGDLLNDDLVSIKNVFHFFSHKRYVKVFSPPGSLIGIVKQKWKSSPTIFLVQNKTGKNIIEIPVSKKPFSKDQPVEFKVRYLATNQIIGTINGTYVEPESEKWIGEYHYNIKFVNHLNCTVKVLVTTAWLIIYKIYFDREMRKELKHFLKKAEREMDQQIKKRLGVEFDNK